MPPFAVRRTIMGVLLLLLIPLLSAAADGRWMRARRDTLRKVLMESGEIEAVHSTVVEAPRIWGMDLQIIEMVPEGTLVDSGQVIVQFDPAQLLTQLEAAKTDLDMRQAELRSLQVQQQAKIDELQRAVQIAEHSLKLAQVQLEQLAFESRAKKEEGRLEVLKAQLALKEARTRLEAQKIIHASAIKKQKLRILQAQNKVRKLEQQLRQLTLRAPLSGLAVYHTDWNGKKPQVGDKVRPARPLIDLPDLNRMRAKIRVNEVDVASVQVGQSALLHLEAFPRKTFTGRVTSIAYIPEALQSGSKIKLFEVQIEIAERDSLLKPGMTVQAQLQQGLVPDAVLVPVGCVFEIDGEPVVFKKRHPHKPVRVRLGARNDLYIQVFDGVSPGEEVSALPGVPQAQPLGYAQFMARIRRPDSLWQRHFTELKRRNLTFDYEAFRNHPRQAAAAAPPAAEEALKQLGLPPELLSRAGKKVKIQIRTAGGAKGGKKNRMIFSVDSGKTGLQRKKSGTVKMRGDSLSPRPRKNQLPERKK